MNKNKDYVVSSGELEAYLIRDCPDAMFACVCAIRDNTDKKFATIMQVKEAGMRDDDQDVMFVSTAKVLNAANMEYIEE